MTFVTKGQVDCLRRAFRSSRLLWLPGTKIGRCFGDTLTSNRRRSTLGAVPRRHERLKTSPFATERSLQGVGGGANLSAALGGLDILVNNAGRQQSRESILDV